MSTLQMPAMATPTLESCMLSALDLCKSTSTRYTYRGIMLKFLDSRQPLTRAGFIAWIASLPDNSARHQRFAAILLLARESHVQGVIDHETLVGIESIPRPRYNASKLGNWLTTAECKRLLSLPNMNHKLGCRDAAILACMLGCGLRAQEMLDLNWTLYQRRDGRRVWADMVGKGGKIRTVPIPPWADKRIQAWKRMQPGGVEYGVYGKYMIFELSYVGLVHVIRKYSKLLKRRFSCHDLRRTMARLMRGLGVNLEQIQLTLGHAHLSTTEKYLGSKLELKAGLAGVDQLDFDEVEEEKESK